MSKATWLVLTITLGVWLAGCSNAPAGGSYRVYVSNEGSGDLTVIDLPMDVLFGKAPKMQRQTKRKPPKDREQRCASANKPEVQVRIKMLCERSQRKDRD